MPTVPGVRAQMGMQADQESPTPEHLLMTAADMHARGQLIENGGGSFASPKTDLKVPIRGRHQSGKRR
jgi:hypothetical protein